MKVRYLLLGVIVALNFSCATDDDSNEDPNQTFLETYKNTVWIYTEEGFTEFRRLNNNERQPYTAWLNAVSVNSDCFSIYDYSIDGFPNREAEVLVHNRQVYETKFTYTQITNPPNTLPQVIQILTYRITDDILEIKELLFAEGEEPTEYLTIFTSTDMDIASIPVCD